VILAVALVVTAFVAPRLATELAPENGGMEWVQVVLAAVALCFLLWSAARGMSPFDVVSGVVLAELIVAEIDLDKRLIGIGIIDWKFFRRATVPVPVRMLVAVLIVGAVAAFLVYTALRWREIRRELEDGLRDGWAWLLVGGFVLFGLPQPFESILNRLVPYPQYFIEESFELVGLFYVALGAAARRRRGPDAADVS
jgi:hypothetical protein